MDRVSRLERWALGALLWGATCMSCTTRLYYQGIPRDAAAMTFCDQTGAIRTVMDAQMLHVLPDGRLVTHIALAEILIHETVHRVQLEARRPKPGVCPPELTREELLGIELEAYCTQYHWAMAHGADSLDVGGRIYRSLNNRFGMWPGKDFDELVAPRWAKACPGYALHRTTP